MLGNDNGRQGALIDDDLLDDEGFAEGRSTEHGAEHRRFVRVGILAQFTVI